MEARSEDEEAEVARAVLGGARADGWCLQCGRRTGLFIVADCPRSLCSRCVVEQAARVRQERPGIPRYRADDGGIIQAKLGAPYLWLSILEDEAEREAGRQQTTPLQAVRELKKNLEADIEAAFGNKSVVLILKDSTAPVVIISRCASDARNVVPVLFMAGTLSEAQRVNQRSGGLTPLVHSLAGARTGSFLVFPYLYDRFDDASRFRSVLTSTCGSLDRWSSMAWTIIDCHVVISENA